MELALIAFDGLDPRVLYNKRDRLPTFDRVIDDSMHGKWNTPGHTIPSFTATLTGQQYMEYDFHWDDTPEGYQRHRQTEFEYLWETCDSTMSILNNPVLYPPEDIEDAMVCGFLTPDEVVDSNLARPDELQEKLNDIGYIHDIDAGDTFEELGAEDMKDLLYNIMELRVVAAEHMIKDYDSDLFYGTWTSTDRWFHQCHKYDVSPIPLYEYADDILDKILSIIPDDVPKIIFSDHGFAHFKDDAGVHKGHMHDGWYSIISDHVPNCRDDSLNIFDLYPTVVNYLEGEVPECDKGRVIFHPESQQSSVEQRLKNLGYTE